MSDVEPPNWHHLPPNPYNPHAWIVGDPTIGDGCWIGAFTVIDGSGGLTIGRGCDISAGAQIYSHSTVGRVMSEGQTGARRAATVIGDFVHIGAAAVILMGAKVGHHSVIGAGSIVLENTEIPPWSIAVGNPARILANRAQRHRKPES